jgi:hypothetical protein
MKIKDEGAQLINTTKKIRHEGEINRACYNPFNEEIIATKTTSAEVHIFNTHQHPEIPVENTAKPDIRLLGNKN